MAIRSSSFFQGQNVKIPPLLLLGLGGLLMAGYATVNLRADKMAHLAMSLVFWCAALSSLWDKRSHLKLGTNIVSIGIGAGLITGILIHSVRPPTGLFLGFASFVSALGMVLLASGIRAISQYNPELLMLFCLGIPKLLLKFLPDISPLTAQFSTFLLWYSGFSVQLDNNHILLPDGGVNVVPACSGLNLITYMLGITVIFLLMFPLNTSTKILAPIVAITLGFIVNGIRVALLALLSTTRNAALFDYWHSNDGALFFVILTVLLFGLFCWWIVSRAECSSLK